MSISSSPLIICFGDSLTAGFQSPTRDNPQGRSTPYGDWLVDMIGPSGRVRVSGICGEVTGEMVLRFRREVLDHHPSYVAILGGTNDLGWNASPAEIMRNLVKMYEQTCAAGAIPLPVTVPSIRVEDSQSSPEGQAWLAQHVARRRELNELILQYAQLKHIPSVDLFLATAEPGSLQLAAVYSNDGVHLTTDGYRLLAEMVSKALMPLLRAEGVGT